MCLFFLHRVKILCCPIINCARLRLLLLRALTFPKTKYAGRISHYQFRRIPGDFKTSYRYRWHIELPKTSRFLEFQVPDLNFAILVPKYYLGAVRVKHCTIYHNTPVVELALVPLGFEIENFYCAVFTSGEKPLVLLLEIHSYHVCCKAIVSGFLVKVPQVVNLNQSIGAGAQIFPIAAQN